MRGVRLALLTLSAVGLDVFRVSGPHTGSAIRLPHLNRQTQEFSTG